MSHADAIAAAVPLEWRKPFEHVAGEVLDDFYLHPSTRSVGAAPDWRRFAGRWLGTVGERLARRRGVAVLAWIDRPQHFRLTAPEHSSSSPALQASCIPEPDPVPTVAPVHNDAGAAAAGGFVVASFLSEPLWRRTLSDGRWEAKAS